MNLNHGFGGRFQHGHGGGWPFGLFFLLILLILGGLLVWSLIRPGGRHAPLRPPAAGAGDPALEQARLRYARGEIDRDEFVRIARDLGSPVSVEEPG